MGLNNGHFVLSEYKVELGSNVERNGRTTLVPKEVILTGVMKNKRRFSI